MYHCTCSKGVGAGNAPPPAANGFCPLTFGVGLRRCRNVQIVGELLADVGPGAFIVLRGLSDRSPVVVVDPEAGAYGGGVRERGTPGPSRGPQLVVVS